MSNYLQHVISSPSEPLKTTAVTTTSLSSKRRGRKRVHFETEDTESTLPSVVDTSSCDDRSVKRRVVEWLPLCREWTASEKQDRWILPHEWDAIRQSIKDEMSQRQDLSQKAQIYSLVYELCQHQDSQFMPNMMLVLPWMACSDLRGLEDALVPRLALARRLARARSIRAVVEAQTNQEPEGLGVLYAGLSCSSRRLGQVLGVADATAAMSEHKE
jgi:hypothetical protein